jgi:hypothetical protein
VTLRARWVTPRARWVTLRARLVDAYIRHDAAAAAAVLAPLALDAAALDALWRRSWGPVDARIEVSVRGAGEAHGKWTWWAHTGGGSAPAFKPPPDATS